MSHAAGVEDAASAVAFSASQIRSRSPAVASESDAVALLTLFGLILGTFDVDPVSYQVSSEPAGVPCLRVVPGGICIAFNVLSSAACFGGIIVHSAV